jgi:hypothetical protein
MKTSLDDTNYKDKMTEICINNKSELESVEITLSIIRIMSIIVIVISSILIVSLIIGIIILLVKNRSPLTKISTEGISTSIKGIFTSRLTYIVFLGSIAFIFLLFLIAYAFILGKINNLTIDGCFSGTSDEGELGQLTSLKNNVITQLIVCVVMFVLFLTGLIVLLVLTRNSNKSAIKSFKNKVQLDDLKNNIKNIITNKKQN